MLSRLGHVGAQHSCTCYTVYSSLRPTFSLIWWLHTSLVIQTLWQMICLVTLSLLSYQRPLTRTPCRHQYSLSFCLCYSTAKTGPHLTGQGSLFLYAPKFSRVHPSNPMASASCTYSVDMYPFPVWEAELCSFVATLARQGLAPGTIHTYLVAVRHAHFIRG